MKAEARNVWEGSESPFHPSSLSLHPSKRPVIIDTDPGVDDALALLLAAASPEIEVLAVTTVAGNVPLEVATENARRILPIAWAGRNAPPLYRGLTGGQEGAEFVHGHDGLGGAGSLCCEDGSPLYPLATACESTPAVEAILSLIASRPGEVTVVALGPLTNLAAAFDADRRTLRKAREVVVMGGAFREPGNVTASAEFNVFADPKAAQRMCGSGVPLRWITLDVTHRCLLREEHLNRSGDSPRAQFARDILRFHLDYHEQGYGEKGCFLHDPTAVAAVLWPELFRAILMRVDVDASRGLARGRTIADFRPPAYRTGKPPNSAVCLETDSLTLVNRIVTRLG